MRRPGHLVRPGASTTCPAPLPRPTRGRGGWLAADERALAKLRIEQPTPDGAELRRHDRTIPVPAHLRRALARIACTRPSSASAPTTSSSPTTAPSPTRRPSPGTEPHRYRHRCGPPRDRGLAVAGSRGGRWLSQPTPRDGGRPAPGMSGRRVLAGRPSVMSPAAVMPSDRGAVNWPVNTVEILTEAAGIAAAPGTLAERAEALLAQLQRVVRFDAGWIGLLVPDQDAHVPLDRAGYDPRVCGYLDGPILVEEIEWIGLRRSPRPLRVGDSPVPLAEIPGWAEYLA